MKERGMLYTGPMDKAIQDLRKTQTRRVMVPQPPDWIEQFGYTAFTPNGHISGRGTYDQHGPAEKFFKCPYGVRGDRLYTKEPHYLYGRWLKNGRTKTGKQKWSFRYLGPRKVFYADNPPEIVRKNNYRKEGWYKRSPLFMPKWAARKWQEIVDVRVERVQDISKPDIIAEGIRDSEFKPASYHEFAELWDSINKKRGHGFIKNDWVWVVEFKVTKP